MTMREIRDAVNKRRGTAGCDASSLCAFLCLVITYLMKQDRLYFFAAMLSISARDNAHPLPILMPFTEPS